MLRTHHLQLRIASRLLLDDLNWTIEAGQFWCLIGRNGAGKSTLLRTLAGLHQPSSGSVAIQGRSLADWHLGALAQTRAFLPQSLAQRDAFAYRVLEIVLSARHPYHSTRYWEDEADHQAAQNALQTMGVAELALRDVRTLSGGERQRVAIAALLAQDTPLLLLDEPANSLDLAHQVGVMNLLAKLCREQGKTVVMVGHDLNLAYRAASHALLLMGEGQWQAGSVAETMQAPLLSRYLGHPIEAVRYQDSCIFVAAEKELQ
ncbi:MAG: ABC transporter ATP-binding protein [Pseudomonadota bacterium]